jgi:hypothetical protein
MPITRSIEINASIDRAFDCVDDNEKVKQWAKGVEQIIPQEPWNPANPVGSKFKQLIREGGRLTEYHGEVVAYDKPRHLGVTLGSKDFSVRMDYRFTRLDARRTRLDYSADTRAFTWIGRVMLVLFGWLNRRTANQQMAALKALAEREA